MSPMRAPTRVSRDDLPKQVTIWEVGPRDGLQNETKILDVATKVEFIERLSAAGLPIIEATSFVRADRIPQLADSAAVFTQIHLRPGTRYPVLVPNERGLADAVACGAREIAVFASATDAFAQRNLGRSLAAQMAMFLPVIERAGVLGMPVRGYVSMCFGDPWEGAVDPGQVIDVCLELLAAGCTTLSLGDTIGVATPGQVRGLLSGLADRAVPIDLVGVHFHDTYGQALSNTFAALESGVTTVDASAGGLGGCPYAESATGNLATEDLVWMLEGLDINTGVELGSLIKTSTWLAERLGRPSASRVVQALGG
jgi:hydroxymethylglutaryl-CoA lyase